MDNPPPGSTPDVGELFHRARDGDQDAWKALYDECYPKVIRVIRRKLQSPVIRSLFDSADFANDVWKSLAANAGHLEFPTMNSLMAFLVKVAEDKLADEQRRQSALKRDRNREVGAPEGLQLAGSDPTPSAIAVGRERFDQLLGQVDETGRKIILLKRLGYGNDEIAGMVNWHVRKLQRFLKGLDDSTTPQGG